MLYSVQTLIREYRMLPRGTRVLCALSGGADSVCLLHWLYSRQAEYGIQVTAAHYNHNLRGEESLRDERFVRELARSLQVELTVGSGDVAAMAKAAGRGIEETAREMRYAFLRQAARETGADVIATAHNLSDNAETILMHLVRGSGLRGLGGISPAGDGLIRPLLTTSREEIEEYLAVHGVSFVEDSSNTEDTYTRNRLRHRVLPELEAICPGVSRRMGQTAQTLREDEDCLQTQAQLLLEQAVWDGERLSVPVAAIARAHDAVAVRAVRRLLGRWNNGDDSCSAAHLRALTALCRSPDPSARIDLPRGLSARREYDRLILERSAAQPEPGCAALNLTGETLWGAWRICCRGVEYRGQPGGPYRFFLSRERTPAAAVRIRQTGDMLRRPGRSGKSLKKLMIEEKIPQRLRDTLPVVTVHDRPAAVAGLGQDEAFLPKVGEEAWEITVTAVQTCGS